MYEQYSNIISHRLSESRFHHSICVADAARRLAQQFGGDPDKAYLAGILHDICKNEPNEKMLQLLDEFGIILDNVQRAEPKLWHAPAGAGYIKCVLGIDDDELYNAIFYHTTARAGMTQLDKILFLADFISDDRDFDGVQPLRKSISKGLDYAVLRCLMFSVIDLCERGKAIHPCTIEAYNEMCTAVTL